MATDIPRIHKWWQQPSPNNDYIIMSNFMPFVPSDLSANAQPPENAVNEQTDRWTDRQTNNNIHKHQGSDQFMNWIGIDNQFNSIQHELNWNWIERFWIGIELELKTWTDRNWSIQSIHFKFNSSFYKVKHFLYAILWKLQCDKQPHVSKHTRMLHCVFPVWGLQGSLDIKGWPLHQLFWDISSALTH